MFKSPSKHTVLHVLGNKGAQPTQIVDTILAYCWTSDADGGPAVGQYWINDIVSAYRVFKMVGPINII